MQRASGSFSNWLIFIVMAAIGLGLYGWTLDVPWYFDDLPGIVNNSQIQSLDLSLRSLWKPRGIVNATFALNYHFGGVQVFGYHLVNIALHLVTTFLVFLLLKRVFAQQQGLAVIGALVFLVHPVQSQTINYVVQRMTGMAAFFFFLSLYLYVRGRETFGRSGQKWSAVCLLFWVGTLLAGGLAMLAKQNAAILPVALLIFDRFFLVGEEERVDWRRLLKVVLLLLPLLAIPALLAYRDLLQPLIAGGQWMQVASTEDLSGAGAVSPLYYLVTEFSVLWLYIRLLFLPFGQMLDYGYPVVTSLLELKSMLALVGLMGLGWLAWRWRRSRPRVSFAIIWFFVTLSVESTLIPLDPVFEHRLYIPLFGFTVLVGELAGFIGQVRVRQFTLGLILVVLSLLTWQRNQLWRDPVAFWQDNANKTFASYRPMISLADAYFQRGEKEKALAVYREQLPRLMSNNALLTQNSRFLMNVGVAYQRGGDLNGAETYLRMAAGGEYGMAYYNLGVVLYEKGDKPGALQAFRRAVDLSPGYGSALYNYAIVANETGDRNTALRILPRLRVMNSKLAVDLEGELRQ